MEEDEPLPLWVTVTALVALTAEASSLPPGASEEAVGLVVAAMLLTLVFSAILVGCNNVLSRPWESYHE